MKLSNYFRNQEKPTMKKQNKPNPASHTIQKKNIFVIMPFVKTPTRNDSDLDEFFRTNIRDCNERNENYQFTYEVKRSDKSFNITDQLIKDLYSSDIVLCDLSGTRANPNVMYELGVRLSITNKPAILFREEHDENERIFDINTYYCFNYKVSQYRKLENYITETLLKYEENQYSFESPIHQILQSHPDIVRRVNAKRSTNILKGVRSACRGIISSLSATFSWYLLDHVKLPKDTALKFSNPNTFSEKFKENRDLLENLDYSKMEFNLNIHPAFYTFIAESPLHGLFDEYLVERMDIIFNTFYNNFWLTPLSFNRIRFNVIATLVSMTRSIEYISICAYEYLISDNEREKKELLEALNGLTQSFIKELDNMANEYYAEQGV